MSRIKLLIVLMCTLLLVGCSSRYKGIDDLMTYSIPDGYKAENNVIHHEDRLVSIHYGKKDTSIYFIMMSYNGKAVMGSNETIKDWLLTQENTLKEYDVKGHKMYIYYPVAFSKGESDKKDMIEGILDYDGYMIMVGMTNNQSDNLTDEEIKEYYEVLKSIRFGEKMF